MKQTVQSLLFHLPLGRADSQFQNLLQDLEISEFNSKSSFVSAPENSLPGKIEPLDASGGRQAHGSYQRRFATLFAKVFFAFSAALYSEGQIKQRTVFIKYSCYLLQ